MEKVKLQIPFEQSKEIQLQFTQKEDNEFSVEFHTPKPCLESVRKTIEEFMKEMPITTRGAFKALLDRIDKEQTGPEP